MSLPPHHLANLIQILHDANKRYQTVADSLRSSRAPTHHARKRAYHLGLTVNVQSAVACPQRHISHVPLPVIDTTPSPRLVPRISIPRRIQIDEDAASCWIDTDTDDVSTCSSSPGPMTPPNVPISIKRKSLHSEERNVDKRLKLCIHL